MSAAVAGATPLRADAALRARPLRIALLGAFAFPLERGSQVFARDHALALSRAGAELAFFCYGRGRGSAPPGLALERVPSWVSPRGLGSGPSAGKPLADLALAQRFARAQRELRFDVALAHHAEAAVAALWVRARTGVPVIYLAHTLLGHELSCYAPPRWKRGLDRLGRRIDAWLGRRCDGAIALCEAAAAELRDLRAPQRGDAARAPGAESAAQVVAIPPGLAPQAAPTDAEIERACARQGLRRGRFALYAGNLDAYQNLEELAVAARALPELPTVAATDPADSAPASLAGLRLARVGPQEARALTWGAALAVAPRRVRGGFPIKLLNYMEAARPIVCRAGLADSLVHARSAWLLSDAEGPAELAAGIARVARDPQLAAALGRGARDALASQHAWPALAERTLRFAERVRSRARGPLATAAAALALALPGGAEPAPESVPAPVVDALLGAARQTQTQAELAASASLEPGQAVSVRELGRDAATSQHLVAIRDAESPHRHDRHAILVVLLRGFGSMLIGTEARPVGPGSILYVPPGTRHAFRNQSGAPAVAYVIYLPPLEGSDRVEDPLPTGEAGAAR